MEPLAQNVGRWERKSAPRPQPTPANAVALRPVVRHRHELMERRCQRATMVSCSSRASDVANGTVITIDTSIDWRDRALQVGLAYGAATYPTTRTTQHEQRRGVAHYHFVSTRARVPPTRAPLVSRTATRHTIGYFTDM